MTSKEEISSSYLDSTKERYLFQEQAHRPKEAIILGYEPGNIGGYIASHLVADGYDVQHPTPQELPAEMTGWKEGIERCDVAVFNNGYTNLDWIENQPETEIYKMILDNLTASILGSAAFVRRTLHTPYRKRIIFIGSMAHNKVLNGSAPYCAAKAGLNHYARCIAYELAPKNYSVFVINPSNVEGAPMSEKTIQGLMNYRQIPRSEAEAYWSAGNINAEFLSRDEVARTVVMCASGEHDYLAGNPIDLAGGMR